jgi:hypothetical protein
LVAGIDGSGDSARPGFGWYFGRDSLWTLYAVNAYGDFQLTRDQLEFLLQRQSSEGQIIHEWSQTAGVVNWKSLPYEFASSDATPFLLMAANDYLQSSGDVDFLKAHWQGLESSHDSDGDGIYENIAGSGWVESWPPGMPRQEIYLAALDQQASTASANLAKATGHSQLAETAGTRAAHIAQQIEKEYFLPDANFYALSETPREPWTPVLRSIPQSPPGMELFTGHAPCVSPYRHKAAPIFGRELVRACSSVHILRLIFSFSIGGQIVVCYPVTNMERAESLKDVSGLVALSHASRMASCNREVPWPVGYKATC